MGAHLIDGQFQSDKYPSCPPGKVPLSVKDVTAQDLLWQYAQRRRAVDAEFSDDLEAALIAAGYVPPSGSIVGRIEVGDFLRSNEDGHNLTVVSVSAEGVIARGSFPARPFAIKLSRIHTDGKPRKSGWTLVKGPL